jgi:predicted PurR-regulated permease PerM
VNRRSSLASAPARPVAHAYRTSLAILAVGLPLVGLFAVRSLLGPLLLGACVAGIVRPWMVRLEHPLRGRKRAAAAVTAMVVLLVVLPLAALAVPIASEVRSVMRTLHDASAPSGVAAQLQTLVSPSPVPPSPRELLHAIGPRLADSLPGVVGVASELALAAFVFLMTLYYVLVDGPAALSIARRISPLAHAHLQALLDELVAVGRGVLLSVGLTSVLEGAAAGIAYVAVGLEGALVLTLLTMVAALVPVGTILVWGPVAIVLVGQGRTGAAATVVFVGLVVISAIDHFLRPQLARLARARLHPLLVFIGMFGGMASLGAFGLFAGPLVVALGASALRLYDRDQQARRALVDRTAATERCDRTTATVRCDGETETSTDPSTVTPSTARRQSP